MKTYIGRRKENGCVVMVKDRNDTERPLDPRNDLRDHSDGFEWGYGGSGPAQLALAMLADHFGKGRDELALKYYQYFKETVVAIIPRNLREWVITRGNIDHEIARIDRIEKLRAVT